MIAEIFKINQITVEFTYPIILWQANMKDQYRFLDSARRIAFYGLKRDGTGFAYQVLNGLLAFNPNFLIIPVHQSAGKLAGRRAFYSAKLISPAAESAVIVLNADNARSALEDAKAGGVRQTWLVLSAAGVSNLDYARSIGMPAVGGCPLLFIPGLGFPHNLHRGMAKLFRMA